MIIEAVRQRGMGSPALRLTQCSYLHHFRVGTKSVPTHSGKLVVNGRIVGIERVLKHESNAREIIKGLLKLLAYGAKQGW
ncbi:MAG: hypothetical protein LUQ11_04370 [Methylococcaceae bacterium]|nr:hypothetical protein [Methylococcaceae bacterium]